MLPTRDAPQDKDLHRLKVKGWKQIFQANGQEKKAGGAILISDFQRGAIKRDPEGHFIMLKGRIKEYTTSKPALQEMLKGLL